MPVRFFAGGRSFLCFARRARWLRITINFLLVALLTLIAVRVVRGCTCHEGRDVANVMQGSYYHTVCTGAALLFLVESYIQCGLWWPWSLLRACGFQFAIRLQFPLRWFHPNKSIHGAGRGRGPNHVQFLFTSECGDFMRSKFQGTCAEMRGNLSMPVRSNDSDIVCADVFILCKLHRHWLGSDLLYRGSLPPHVPIG